MARQTEIEMVGCIDGYSVFLEEDAMQDGTWIISYVPDDPYAPAKIEIMHGYVRALNAAHTVIHNSGGIVY